MKHIKEYSHFLNEVGDSTPLDWRWNQIKSDSRMIYYNFFLGGEEYEVRLIRDTRPVDTVDVQFSVNNSTQTITGAGAPFTVFATVVSIIKNYLAENPTVDQMTFTPSMNYSGDRRRLRIYLRYLESVFPGSESRLASIGGGYYEVIVKLNGQGRDGLTESLEGVNYFNLVNRENPFSGLSRLGKTQWLFRVGHTDFIIKDDGSSAAKLMHDGKKVAECLYSKSDTGTINIDLIAADVQGKGYAKLLMLHIINRFGIENIDRKVLTSSGRAMFNELDRFLNFNYDEWSTQRTNHINKGKLISQLALTRPLISVFLETVCDYGKDTALQVFSGDIHNQTVDGYPIHNLFKISEWIDGSVEYRGEGREIPDQITRHLNELL